MIKAGDKIGFKRTEYGVQEFGTYRGYADGKYSVEMEGGEIVEMTTESYSGSKWATKSPMSGMRHHIGWLLVKEDFDHCDRGYECAAWFENMKVAKGGRFPLFAWTRDEYSSEKNANIEGSIDSVTAVIDGTIINDDFGSRFCGNPIGNYDESKNAGKKTTHHLTWYGYQFGNIVRGTMSDYRYADQVLGIPCEIELFDSVLIAPHSFDSTDLDGNKKIQWSSTVTFVRATDEPLDIQVQKYLTANGRYDGVYMVDGEVVVEIEHGDWKHDHGNARYLVKKFFKAAFGKEVVDNQTVTDENGSDNYSAIHTFSEVK